MYQLQKVVSCEIRNQHFRKVLIIFIKAVMFQHVGISWIIQYRDKSTFFLRGSIILRFKMGLGIIQKYFHICVAVLLNISFHCHIKTGTILYVLSMCITTFMQRVMILVSIGCGRLLSYGSTTDVLKSLYDTLNFFDIWLQKFVENYVWNWNVYQEK